MIVIKAVVFSLLVTASWCKLDFPPGFKFGAATAAYQVEGAWNSSDKGESMWDTFSHKPGKIKDGSTGEVACDSYHQYKRDVEIVKELGLHYYRFSISWPRLLPNGFANVISEDGKNHYNNLIDELLRNNIEPMVTLYHWDLPQNLQDLGGWTNPLIAEWLADFARIAFKLFGDRVPYWITINEPISMCSMAYATGILAPGINNTDAQFLCAKNVLMAHAKVYRLYEQEFRSQFNGQVSISNAVFWFEPLTESDKDKDLTDLVMQYEVGRYAHAIYSEEGGWPRTLEKFMEIESIKKGYPRSILPPFTEEEKEFVRGTYDFFALNHYASGKIRALREGDVVGTWPLSNGSVELGVVVETGDWDVGTNKYMGNYPGGLRKTLNWLKEQYGDMKIMITENGYGSNSSRCLEDDKRVKYFETYLEQVLLAIKDGVDVVGYTAWSLMDNFEWSSGYTTKFGLYEVDFEDPERTRTPRKSAYYYYNVIKHHSLDIPYDYYNEND